MYTRNFIQTVYITLAITGNRGCLPGVSTFPVGRAATMMA
jgi:hypothetical protein